MTGPPSIPALRARLEYLAVEVRRLNGLWRRSELALPLDPKECRPPRQLAAEPACQSSPPGLSRESPDAL